MHGCVISIVATDILVLKHQARSFLSDDFLNYPRFIQKYYIYCEEYKKLKLHFEKLYHLFKG